MPYKIKFEPSGITYETSDLGETLLDIARKCGESICADCGGNGVCGKCRLRIVCGGEKLSDVTDIEKKYLSEADLKNNVRLACKAKIYGDVIAEVPEESRIAKQIVLSDGRIKNIPLKPFVKAFTVTLPRPSIKDSRDDFSRLCDELKKQNAFDNAEISYSALKKLPSVIRQGKWTVTVFVSGRNKITEIFPDPDIKPYGVAVDIGTTTIAAFLCDLVTGKTVQTASAMNPQVRFGDDVLARISYSINSKPDGLENMQKILINGINDLITEMAKKQCINSEQIGEVIFAGNTVMQHIALCIPPDNIGVSPFTASITDQYTVRAIDIGLLAASESAVYCMPSEAGFVGGDNVAVLIAEEPYKSDDTVLIADIGTNSEIAFGNREKLYVTSCASGPALEGAQIQCGMRAADGAIEHININPETLEPELKIIGRDKGISTPVGICGSGIIDAIAQMAKTGIIRSDGRFSDGLNSRRIRKNTAGKSEYVLYFAQNEKEHDITINLKDIRAVQLAKAAICTGAEMLIRKSGMPYPKKLILAGAFGSYISPGSVIEMGMFPFFPEEDIIISGNSAGVGARYALMNTDKRSEAEKVSKSVIFVETAADPDFQKIFARNMKLTGEQNDK